MTIQQIATAYGISQSAVKKWPLAKRATAIRELELGVCPIIKRLCGEIAELCVVASAVNKTNVQFDTYHCYPAFNGHVGMFSVYYYPNGIDAGALYFAQNKETSAKSLLMAKTKLQELCNGL
jgi:hypothetical protein